MIKGFKIDPEAWYDTTAVRRELGITDTSIRSARLTGELRFSKRGQRYLYQGEWLLNWLRTKEAN